MGYLAAIEVGCGIFTARKRSLRRLCFYRCLSFCPQGGHAWLLGGHAWLLWGVRGCSWGGMHGRSRGGHAWFLLGGHAWFYSGGCVWFYSGGMHGFIWGGRGACMVLFGGLCGFIWGACMVLFRGACVVLFGGRGAWFFRIQWDTVNERAVRILLECILVTSEFPLNFLRRADKGWNISHHIQASHAGTV